MKQLFLLWGSWLISGAHAYIFQRGPLTLKLYCIDSDVILRGSLDIECAIITRFNSPYNYAFPVRDGRCYVCRTADAVGRYSAQERQLHGPHHIKGGVNYLIDQLFNKCHLLLKSYDQILCSIFIYTSFAFVQYLLFCWKNSDQFYRSILCVIR